jgi:hypothetical protein
MQRHTLTLSLALTAAIVAAPLAHADPTATHAAVAQARTGTRAQRDRDAGLVVEQFGRRVSSEISANLSLARRGQNGDWGRCLDHALAESNAALRMLDLARERLDQSHARSDAAQVRRMRRMIRHVRRRFLEIQLSARACSGDERVQEGTVEIVVERAGQRDSE